RLLLDQDFAVTAATSVARDVRRRRTQPFAVGGDELIALAPEGEDVRGPGLEGAERSPSGVEALERRTLENVEHVVLLVRVARGKWSWPCRARARRRARRRPRARPR